MQKAFNAKINSGQSIPNPGKAATSLQLDLLASAALQREKVLSLTKSEFAKYLSSQPAETIDAIYNKSVRLLNDPSLMTRAPGCNVKDRVVSGKTPGKFHHVTYGKKLGEYRCDKSCPMWKGIKICSHTVASAEDNKELIAFVNGFSRYGLMSQIVSRLTCQSLRGKKANDVKKSKCKQPKPLVVERGPRLEANTNPFFVKPMSNRIKVCQGCPVAMTDANGLIPSRYRSAGVKIEAREYRGSA